MIEVQQINKNRNEVSAITAIYCQSLILLNCKIMVGKKFKISCDNGDNRYNRNNT